LFIGAIAVASALVTIAHTLIVPVHDFFVGLGPWYMVALMAMLNSVYWVGLYLGRKSLLGTRLNRRVAGVLGVGTLGPLVNRIIAVQSGAGLIQTLVADMVLTAACCAVAGLSLHSGFFTAGAIMLVGAVAAATFARTLSMASWIYSMSAILGIVAVALSWRRWRNELWIPGEEKKE
jgi:hypothetical protein